MKKVVKEFPKIYRVITERFKKSFKKNSRVFKKIKFQWLVILYVVTAFLILILSFDLLSSLQKQKEINFERTKIESEIKLWEALSAKYQGYKESYYELALLNYRIGQIDKAKFYVNKALYIDPNFSEAKNLQMILKSY